MVVDCQHVACVVTDLKSQTSRNVFFFFFFFFFFFLKIGIFFYQNWENVSLIPLGMGP